VQSATSLDMPVVVVFKLDGPAILRFLLNLLPNFQDEFVPIENTFRGRQLKGTSESKVPALRVAEISLSQSCTGLWRWTKGTPVVLFHNAQGQRDARGPFLVERQPAEELRRHLARLACPKRTAQLPSECAAFCTHTHSSGIFAILGIAAKRRWHWQSANTLRFLRGSV